MIYEIEFKMIEIKDITKIQKREVKKEVEYGTEVEFLTDIASEYCKKTMEQVRKKMGEGCLIDYLGSQDRIGNYIFEVYNNDVKYIIIFQQDTYECSIQFTVKIGYVEHEMVLQMNDVKNMVDEYDFFLEKLKIYIKNAMIRDWKKCVWIRDNQSTELSSKVYSNIYMAENELRSFVSKVMIENLGIDWYDRPEFYKLNACINENSANIRRNVPNFNNIDVTLYTATLETLIHTIKADIYSDTMIGEKEKQRIIKKKIFETTQLDRMQAMLDYLKNSYVKEYNIWENLFAPLISDLQQWDLLLNVFILNRNHVAHNKLLDYASKERMIQDTGKFRDIIKEAMINFDQQNQSEEVEETLQAIAQQKEYEKQAELEIIESESGIRIREKNEILKLFQSTIDEIYTDAISEMYFDQQIEISNVELLKDTNEEQLLFTICGSKQLSIYGIAEIDDTEGASSILQIQSYEDDSEVADEKIIYINGAAEYCKEQCNYMASIEDRYEDDCKEIVKEVIGEFISKEREEKEILMYEEENQGKEDWIADASDILEGY